MRYNSLFHEPPSPSDAGLIIKTGTSLAKGPRKPAPLILQQQASPRLPPASPALQKQQKIIQPRLPNSQRHLIRKASISTGESSHSVSAVERPPSRRQPPSSEAKKVLKAMPEQEEQTGAVQISSPRRETQQAGAANKPGSLHKNSSSASPSCLVAPRLKAWESYLHWLCLTEEPGTLWASSLCATFHECLLPEPPTAGGVDGREHNATNNNKKMTAAECAARVDDIYWSFYLPLDPLHQCMEDRILSGYLLHVWTMFVELGKRIPHDDPTQDRLVGLLKELVALPPMEVRTWNGNDAPWSDLPTLDDALISGWDDLYDPEIQMADPETHWVNYFSFLGRLVAAGVTPDWWEIPAVTLQDVRAEEVTPTALTRYKTAALAEFMNHAGDAFFDWTIDSGLLSNNASQKDVSTVLPFKERAVRAQSIS